MCGNGSGCSLIDSPASAVLETSFLFFVVFLSHPFSSRSTFWNGSL